MGKKKSKGGGRIQALTPKKGSGNLQLACFRWEEGGLPKSNCKKKRNPSTEVT